MSSTGLAEFLLELALQGAEAKFGHKFAPFDAQCSQCSERAIYAVEDVFLCSLHHHVWLQRDKKAEHHE